MNPIAHTVRIDGSDTNVASMTSFRLGMFLITRKGRRTRRTRNTFITPPMFPETWERMMVTKDMITMKPSRQFQLSLTYARGPLYTVYAFSFTPISTANAVVKK